MYLKLIKRYWNTKEKKHEIIYFTCYLLISKTRNIYNKRKEIEKKSWISIWDYFIIWHIIILILVKKICLIHKKLT